VSPEWWWLAGGAALAGFVQGISGFAFGLVVMSLWVWRLEPQTAVVLSIVGALTGQLFTAVTVRRPLHLQQLWPFVAGALLGVPLGVMLLPLFTPNLFKLCLGTLLLLVCPAMWWAERLPPVRQGGRLGDALAGVVGGVMGGAGGFTGVAPALWGTVRRYDKDLHRAVMQNFNIVALSATFVGFLISGAFRAEMAPQAALVAVCLVLPSMLGARVYVGLSPQTFRRLVLFILFVAGLMMVASALLNLYGIHP
jgi:uncharacterized protein